MKKLKCLITTLILYALNTGTYSQKLQLHSPFNLNSTYAKSDIKIPSNSSVSREPVRNNIYWRTIRNFEKKYSGIDNEKWELVEHAQTPKGRDGANVIRYVVRFPKDGKKVTVAHDKKGGLVHTIFTYSEKYLPKAERHIVKSNYYDYQIHSVREIHIPEVPYIIYMVSIENENQILQLRLSDNGLDVLEILHKRLILLNRGAWEHGTKRMICHQCPYSLRS